MEALMQKAGRSPKKLSAFLPIQHFFGKKGAGLQGENNISVTLKNERGEFLNFDWKKLQNGSDIRGVAIPIEGVEVNLNEFRAASIGRAFALWVSEKKKSSAETLRIAAGRDSRLSGDTLLRAFLSGVESTGAKGYDCGLASTPAMFMGTVFDETGYDGSVMVTASHLPFNRNGFKFFTRDGGFNKEDVSRLLEMAAAVDTEIDLASDFEKFDLMGVYSNFLVSTIRQNIATCGDGEQPLGGMKIVVDAGNGAGGFFVERVLKPLGANTEGSRYLEPDGTFPNHEPNPENGQAMASIRDALLQSKADLGIIFDTDVDRSAIVSAKGETINRNRLIALMSAIVLEENPGTTIVTDSVTSEGLTEFITGLGGVHHRFKRGYRNVINESLRLNESGQCSALAMETSGHGAMRENYFLDDGAYTIVKILIKMAQMKMESGRDIMELIADLNEPAESQEFRISLLEDDFKIQGEHIIGELEKYLEKREDWQPASMNYEGMRIEADQGWFLLRLSLHDPVLPLNVESNIAGGSRTILQEVRTFLKQFKNIEYKELNHFLDNREG